MSSWKERRAARRRKAGDGHPLKPYRWWQPLSRSLFHLPLQAEDGRTQTWSVDVRLAGDSEGEVWAKLYRDGQHHASSKLPALFPVPGGTIEVATSDYGLKRLHYVAEDGAEHQLVPDPASAEGRRANLQRKHPAAGRIIGLTSICVLVVALVLGVPQIIEQITRIPPVAEHLGTFTSPFQFPPWFNLSLAGAALVASTERALRLRHSRLLDGGGGLFDGTA